MDGVFVRTLFYLFDYTPLEVVGQSPRVLEPGGPCERGREVVPQGLM